MHSENSTLFRAVDGQIFQNCIHIILIQPFNTSLNSLTIAGYFLLKCFFTKYYATLSQFLLKEKFSDNLGQNIRRIFHFLAKFLFTISETEPDYYHQKVSPRVVSRVTERIKT